jgi:hypothetical protein
LYVLILKVEEEDKALNQQEALPVTSFMIVALRARASILDCGDIMFLRNVRQVVWGYLASLPTKY